MRAAVLESPNEPLTVGEVDVEEPRAGEVAVRVHATCAVEARAIDAGGLAQVAPGTVAVTAESGTSPVFWTAMS